jgi:hypothetical protein
MKSMERLTRTIEEIVADIAKKLGAGEAESEAYIRDFIQAVVPLKEYSAMIGNRQANEKYARRILKWIDDGDNLLAEVPESHLLPLLFGHKQNAPVNTPERLESLIRQAKTEFTGFADSLAMVRSRCEFIIQAKVGEHGNAGHVQDRAAIGAISLCEKFGQPLAWSSLTSAYRTVASCIYEAMTGEYDRDMERACESMAARRRTQTEKR